MWRREEEEEEEGSLVREEEEEDSLAREVNGRRKGVWVEHGWRCGRGRESGRGVGGA